MEKLPAPHNNFFQFALSDVPNARSLIRSQLPSTALAELNLDTLKLETGSFVDSDLSEKFSDLLFSVQLAKSESSVQWEGEADEALVYFLFEHKSHSDPLTVLQLLSYMLRIWEKRNRDSLPLCPIVPLIVYHGETGWSAARSLSELIPTPAGLAEYAVNFRPQLMDLSQLNDDEIEGEPVLRGSLQLLKYSRSKRLVEILGEILKLFASIPEEHQHSWIEAIGIYLMTANKNIDSKQYKQTLKSVFPTQFEPGSLADRLLEQGREQGREEGREEGALAGKIQLLEELLGQPATPDSEFHPLGLDELSARLEELQQKLRDRTS